MNLIAELNKEVLAAEKPQVRIGDTVRVHVKVKEGSRERIQVFEGTVIAKKHGGLEETFTVRRVSYGVGVVKRPATLRCAKRLCSIVPPLADGRRSLRCGRTSAG